MLSVSISDVVHQAYADCKIPDELLNLKEKKGEKVKVEGERSISQKIFVILLKLLEALSDKDLNQRIDSILIGRIEAFKKSEHETSEPLKESTIAGENSASMTVTKMILHNLHALLRVAQQLQDNFFRENGA